MQRLPVLGAVLVVAAACQDATSPNPIATPPATVNAAKDNGAASTDYIVVLRDGESDTDGKARALVKAHGGQLKHVYKKALKGFVVSDLSDDALDALRDDPSVDFVEADQIMTAVGFQSDPPSWGLDRIDQTSLPLDKSFTYQNSGAGVTAYIIDTGINSSSSDFGSRISRGKDFVDNDDNPADCNGHGTHVAGTVAGTTYGIAKAATIVAIRVLNCQGSGSNAGVIAGVDWVAANAVKPAVANMSLGGGLSSALNLAVSKAVQAGVTFAVAAGNSNRSACDYSPSSEPSALTVGATTSSDAKASYSNYGSCVDIQAPGSGITSDWIGADGTTNTISGTSMASPHVAGAAALVLGVAGNGNLTPAQVGNELVTKATTGKITGLPSGTVNKLLYIGTIGVVVNPPADPAKVTVNQVCTNFSCKFTPSVTNGTAIGYAWKFSDENSVRTTATVERSFERRKNYTFILDVETTNGPAQTSGTVNCNSRSCH
jgi:subtilisin family serine protease